MKNDTELDSKGRPLLYVDVRIRSAGQERIYAVDPAGKQAPCSVICVIICSRVCWFSELYLVFRAIRAPL